MKFVNYDYVNRMQVRVADVDGMAVSSSMVITATDGIAEGMRRLEAWRLFVKRRFAKEVVRVQMTARRAAGGGVDGFYILNTEISRLSQMGAMDSPAWLVPGIDDETCREGGGPTVDTDGDIGSVVMFMPDPHGMGTIISFNGQPWLLLPFVNEAIFSMNYIHDWFCSLPTREALKVPRMSMADAIRAAHDWHVAIQRREIHGQERSEASPIAVARKETGAGERIDLGDGMYWIRLETADELRRETESQSHCVGRGSYDRYVGEHLQEVPIGIWSLRKYLGDQGIEVFLTAEVGRSMIFQYDRDHSTNLRQVKAVNNLPPLPEWQPWIDALQRRIDQSLSLPVAAE